MSSPAWMESILGLVFPPFCIACGEGLQREIGESPLCRSCEMRVSLFGKAICETCGWGMAEGPVSSCSRCPRFEVSFSYTRSACAYTTPVREMIHRFKFQGSFRVRPVLFDLFRRGADRYFEPADFDVIVPVPLHWFRRFRREFNQSELLAENLAEEWDVPLIPKAVRRKGWTLPQSRLPGKLREENVRDAFAPGSQSVAGARVLLVDDVMTTGRTLSACSETLLKAGAAEIVGYTLARRG